MTAGMAAVFATNAAIQTGIDRRDRCPATTPVDLDPEIWGDDDYQHRCLFDPGHGSTHRCRDCKHTWEDA